MLIDYKVIDMYNKEKGKFKMEEKEEIYITTRGENGLKVRIPMSKLQEFVRNQENPDKERIAETKEKLNQYFLNRRK